MMARAICECLSRSVDLQMRSKAQCSLHNSIGTESCKLSTLSTVGAAERSGRASGIGRRQRPSHPRIRGGSSSLFCWSGLAGVAIPTT